MLSENKTKYRLFRPSDVFLPAAFLAASVMGRGTEAIGLYVALFAVKLCSLASSDALRTSFSVQPSMKTVQGSVVIALLLQLPGALLAALAFCNTPGIRPLLPMVFCGLSLNIEHIFYEYLYSIGDKYSAMLCRGITAVMTLTGLLLCAPPSRNFSFLGSVEPIWPLLTTGLSALSAAAVGLSMGGSFHPKLNMEILRRAPVALLQSSLCPALTLATLVLLWPGIFHPAPLFFGLGLYEACRSPFRRTARESKYINRILLGVTFFCTLIYISSQFVLTGPISAYAAMTCASLLIAAACGFAMFGNASLRDMLARLTKN